MRLGRTGAALAAPTGAPLQPTAAILKQVRRLEIRTRGLVNTRFAGEYQSVFKGRGIEFAEVREYQPGDDVRTIDWNVTARLSEPYVKRHVEERELTVMLVVDLSGSQNWATAGRLKAELVAEVATALAMTAVRNNDRVGLLLFTDRVEYVLPPRKGRRHVLRLVRDLLSARPVGRGTDLAAGLRYATRVLRGRSVVFLFSDFRVDAGSEAVAGAVRRAALRHDLIPVHLLDPGEGALPDVGLLRVEDPESGELVLLDTSDPGTRAAFDEAERARRAGIRRLFTRHGLDEITLTTDRPYAAPLLSFFRARETRRRR